MACLQTCSFRPETACASARIVRSPAGRDALFPLGGEGKKRQRGTEAAAEPYCAG